MRGQLVSELGKPALLARRFLDKARFLELLERVERRRCGRVGQVLEFRDPELPLFEQGEEEGPLPFGKRDGPAERRIWQRCTPSVGQARGSHGAFCPSCAAFVSPTKALVCPPWSNHPRFFIIYSNSYLEKCKVFVKSSIEKREKI